MKTFQFAELTGRFDSQENEDPITTNDLLAGEEDEIESSGNEDETEEENVQAGGSEGDADKDNKDKEEEDEIELVEDEEEDNKPLITPASKKKILAKYPNLEKDFPHLFVANFRDQQYTELFGTVDNAREVKERVEAFDKFETSLFSGTSSEVLKEVRENDPEAFNKIVDNYIEDLKQVDKGAAFAVIGNVIKIAIDGALRDAKESENEDLQSAASLFYKWMFGEKEEFKLRKFSGQEDPERVKVKKEREDWLKENFEAAESQLEERTDNKIRATIDAHIDPNKRMSPYVKKNAIRDAMNELKETIKRDKTFAKSVLDPLWKKASEDKFSRASLDKIATAYLSKSKSLLRPIINKARNEALKGTGRREEKDRNGPLRPTRSSTSSSNTGGNKAGEIPRGMKTFDYLNSD